MTTAQTINPDDIERLTRFLNEYNKDLGDVLMESTAKTAHATANGLRFVADQLDRYAEWATPDQTI